MFNFENTELIILFLLIPLMIFIFMWYRRVYVANLRKFGKIEVIKNLMPDSSKYIPVIKMGIYLLVAVSLIFILCRPRTEGTKEDSTTAGNEIFIILDVSNSMLASASEDQNATSRLQKAKMMLEKLINNLKNNRVGLIVFAGNAYLQLPMTSDVVSAKQYLEIISTDMVPSQGTAISDAIELASNAFTEDDTTHKAIILITDCEDHDGLAVEAASKAIKQNIQVDVIGLGSTKEMPIPINKEKTEFLKDFNGETVYTALNENLAKEIAKAGNGIYVDGNSSSAVNNILSQLNKLAKSQLKIDRYDAASEQFPFYAWIALIFLIIDIFIMDKKISWLRNIKFFSKE